MASLAGQKPHCLGPRTARAKEGLMPWAGRGALGGGEGGTSWWDSCHWPRRRTGAKQDALGINGQLGRAWRDASAEPKRVAGQGGNPYCTAPTPTPALRTVSCWRNLQVRDSSHS